MLSDAIEELYRVHRDIALDPEITYCDHCVGPDEVEELRLTPLRSLGPDPILRLLANAPSGTLGDMTYFRHFLPRVVELAVRGTIWASSIEIGLWRALKESDPAQRAAILAVLDAWWLEILSTWPSPTSADDFLDLVDWCELPPQPYLDAWAAHGTMPAALHVRTLIPVGSDTVQAWLASGAVSALLRSVPPHPDLGDTLEIVEYFENEAAG